MDSENSLLNTNNLIPFSIIEKLSNSIACAYYNPHYKDYPPLIGTGFFIKLKLKKVVTPYFCTAKHVIEDILKAKQKIKKIKEEENKKDNKKKEEQENEIEDDNIIPLLLNKIDDNNKKITIDLIYDETKKDIISFNNNIDGVKFIELLKEEVKDISINYLELEKEYLSNPIKYVGLEAIMAGYPAKYIKNPLKDWPLLSYGNILKIKNNSILVYNMETHRGSSGSPVCIINKKNELKLIGIHYSHDPIERLNYNEGMLFGPILRNILNDDDIIEINNDDDIDKIQNIIKNISDKFDDLINKEKKNIEIEKRKKEREEKEMSQSDQMEEAKNNNLNNIISKPIIFYNNIFFYKNAIDEECNKINKDRSHIYYQIIHYHLKNIAFNLFEDNMNKILLILNNFEDLNSSYKMIREFNEDIITFFNRILLSEDYDLKSKLIYFIAAYKNALNEMNCRYNFKNSNLYHRKIMSGEIIKNIIDHKGRTIAFKFFIDKIIPDTYWNKKYYDLKFSLNKSYKRLLEQIKNSDYDTKIYIEYNNKNNENKDSINCYQISNSEIVIEPFTLFKIKEESTINYDEQTADIYLKIEKQDLNSNPNIEILPSLI